MRRKWRPLLSALWQLYGVRPWEIELLTFDELDAIAKRFDPK